MSNTRLCQTLQHSTLSDVYTFKTTKIQLHAESEQRNSQKKGLHYDKEIDRIHNNNNNKLINKQREGERERGRDAFVTVDENADISSKSY